MYAPLVDDNTSNFYCSLTKCHCSLEGLKDLSHPVTKSAYFTAWLLHLDFK